MSKKYLPEFGRRVLDLVETVDRSLRSLMILRSQPKRPIAGAIST